MIRDTRLARRVNNLIGKFGNEHARFDSAGCFEVQLRCRVIKFIQTVENIKIYNPRRGQISLLCKRRDFCRRISLGVKGINRMKMHICKFCSHIYLSEPRM